MVIKFNGDIIGERGHVLRPQDNGNGYKKVQIKGKQQYIHRLVAEEYLANPLSLPEVNHIDGNKENNHVVNLEWITHRANLRAFNPSLRLSETKVRLIRELIKEGCLICDIAQCFNVHQSTISSLKDNNRWKEV